MTQNNFLNLIGAGGHGKVIASCALLKGYSIDHIFDMDPTKVGVKFWGKWSIEAMPESPWWMLQPRASILSIGSNIHRKRLAEQYGRLTSWTTLIHPTAYVDESATIGEGTFVAPNVTIHPDARIGKHVIINSGAVIEHDVVIHDYCHIAPNAVVAGHGHCGEGVLLGVGSQMIPSMRVGDWSVIGAGSTVIKDVSANTVSVGSPAKPL